METASSMDSSSMVNRLSDHITTMSVSDEQKKTSSGRSVHTVNRRMKALKRLEYETIKHEVKFYERLHELEAQLQAELHPIEQRRSDIINGVVEPTDDECEWSTDESDSEEFIASTTNGKADVKGIPDFWLNLLENKSFLVDPIQEHDRPVLKHLKNVRVVCLPKGSRLEFIFEPNEYFDNIVLCKEYHVDLSPSSVHGKKLKYYGPRNVAVFGCVICWCPGMDVTRIPYSEDSAECGFKESFFNMFGRSGVLGPDLDDDLNSTLEAEFSLCRLLQQTILPRAASIYSKQYYVDNEEFDDDEMHDEEDDEDYDPRLE